MRFFFLYGVLYSYLGERCDLIDCSGVENCNGNGVCTEPNICECEANFKGAKCSEATCSSLNFCSYNGNCTLNQTCICNAGYFENDCNKASCAQLNDCSGSGVCVGPNKCQCLKGYEGDKCDMKIQENKFVSYEFLDMSNHYMIENISVNFIS